MRFSERLAAANWLQQQRSFKLVASAVILVLAVALTIGYVVMVKAPANAPAPPAPPRDAAVAPDGSGAPSKPTAGEGADHAPADVSKPEAPIDATTAVLNNILASRESVAAVGVAVWSTAIVALVVTWLGLALTYLSLIALAMVLVVPLWLVGGRGAEPWIIGVVGLIGLLASFSALMQAAKLLLSPPGAMFAVAKNVLAEATRAKLSLVFIILLVFGMALLPHLLDPEQPLRYRVQTFIQSGTAGSFWLIAVLVVAFSISTVAFEQRDKVIWQTMTKPVAHWQYLLGKWVGVVTLAGILLTVSGTAIYVFTDYLRSGPAIGETKAYVSASGELSQDRFDLETLVLTAREPRQPDEIEFDQKILNENIQQKVELELQRLGELHEDEFVAANRRAALTEKIREDVIKGLGMAYRSIEPGGTREYVFSGLSSARDSQMPIFLRLKPSAGSNSPDQIYKLTLEIQGLTEVKECALGQFHSFPLSPEVIDGDGKIVMRIHSGQIGMRGNQTVIAPNPETVSFGSDGIEVTYAAGSFASNFVRAYAVLLIKLGFLAMVSIWSATYLSFSVACLVSFGVFLSAEGAGFLKSALESFATEDAQGKMLILNVVTAKITGAVSFVFRVYSDLRPTTRLVDGLRLTWGQAAYGIAVLAVWTVVLFGAAVVIFRRRELATYSGQ